MTKNQKFYLMAVVAFWGFVIYAAGLSLVSWLADVPMTYQVAVGSYSLTINRWFDAVLFFPIHLNIILSIYLWLFPVLERRGVYHDDLVAALGSGLVVGIGAGIGTYLVADLGAGIGVGLVAGLGAGIAAGLGIGLVADLVAALGVGLVAGLGADLGAAFAAGLGAGIVVGLGVGLGTGIGVGLGVGLGAGIAAGLGFLGKLVIDIHKKVFRKIQ